MKTKIINTIGLVCGIIGVLMIFKWGPPQPNLNPGTHLSLHNKTVMADGTSIQEVEDKKAMQKEEQQMYSLIGLGFIGVGFMVQLVAIWYPSRVKPNVKKEASLL